MSDIEEFVRRALDTYRSAVLAKDVDAFMQLYAADARIFDTWGVWSYESAAAFGTAVEGWLSSLGDESVRVRFDDVMIVGEQGLASMSAVATYAAFSPAGQPLRAMQNRISWVLRSGGQGLRIIHEHTSVPIGFDDLKGILKREKDS